AARSDLTVWTSVGMARSQCSQASPGCTRLIGFDDADHVVSTLIGNQAFSGLVAELWQRLVLEPELRFVHVVAGGVPSGPQHAQAIADMTLHARRSGHARYGVAVNACVPRERDDVQAHCPDVF